MENVKKMIDDAEKKKKRIFWMWLVVCVLTVIELVVFLNNNKTDLNKVSKK